MIKVNAWIDELIGKLDKALDERLLFVGLQGSYVRGEATEDSDLDIMVVLDELDIAALKNYKDIVASMESSDKACGFICGKDELYHWPKYELFHVLNETKDCYGNLRELIPEFHVNDIRDYVRINAANLYHAVCHTFIYSSKEDTCNQLYHLYKGTFFILQNNYYVENGEYVRTKAELATKLTGDDKEILDVLVRWNDVNKDLQSRYEHYISILMNWCKAFIIKYQ